MAVGIEGLTKATSYCVYTALSPGSGDAAVRCFTTDDVPTQAGSILIHTRCILFVSRLFP